MEETAENRTKAEEVYRRFLDGDESAFEEIVALFEDELSVFINRIVNDKYEAKHLTIQAFAELALCRGRFCGKSTIKTYLFAIAKNLAYQHVKARRHEPHISFEEINEMLQDKAGTPHDLLEQEEANRVLHEAIWELKDEYRVVLELLYFEDMSYAEAGRLMKKNAKQIDNLAVRAKVSLKKALESRNYKADAI